MDKKDLQQIIADTMTFNPLNLKPIRNSQTLQAVIILSLIEIVGVFFQVMAREMEKTFFMKDTQ